MNLRAAVILLGLAALSPACAADTDKPTWESCAAIPEASTRLACYDEVDKDRDSFDAHVVGIFDGCEPKQRFTLDNGQVWRCAEDSAQYFGKALTDPEVTIMRGVFGSHWMLVKELNRKLRVQRVK